ncbi:hypothetical protein [Gemmata sp.]|uniref:hypothetical protein n=1 Tax=Gemmata sp. TaxID=1914242 RepID=UPI003F726624
MPESTCNVVATLESKLRRLRRVRAELIDQGDPVPAELDDEIRGVATVLRQITDDQA